ncbi:MAG: sulfotransferase [Myxococcota bacterium]
MSPPPPASLLPADGFAASEEALLDAACQAAGCDDFGDPDFLEPLRILLEAYDQEACLTELGQGMVRDMLLGMLRNRLVVQRYWNERPEILAGEIRRPLFVVGFPRTGTTALHHLLGRDPRRQLLEYWVAAAPCPRPPREQWDAQPGYQEAEASLRLQYERDPSLKAIHVMSPELPDECRHIWMQDFADDTFEVNACIPSYSKWYARKDMRPVYRRHRDVLKLIQSSGDEVPWVLKYSGHLRHLGALLDVYPDACVVWTHRDPTTVVSSYCSLASGWRALFEREVDRHALGGWLAEVCADSVDRAMEVRKHADPARFYDLDFREIVRDPVGAVRDIYARFDFELDEQTERSMREWHAGNPQGKHGEHVYRAEDYGLSREGLADRFGAYMREYAVPLEDAR